MPKCFLQYYPTDFIIQGQIYEHFMVEIYQNLKKNGAQVQPTPNLQTLLFPKNFQLCIIPVLAFVNSKGILKYYAIPSQDMWQP